MSALALAMVAVILSSAALGVVVALAISAKAELAHIDALTDAALFLLDRIHGE